MNQAVTVLRNRSAQGTLVGFLGAGLLAVLLSQAAHAQQGEESDAESAEQEAAEQVDQVDQADAQARQERDDLAGRLQERERQLRDAQRELAALRARLPAAEGGDLDLDGALRSASVTVGAIRATRAELMRAGGRDAALEESIDELIDELERDQRLVARGLDANLYRVQRGDTLAGIAGRFYGSTQRWQELHEANRHVLENPDLVWPGLTLVVPR
jgi:nucleoid-associated protein YgaU